MSERTMQALRDRINARLQTSAISRDRASAAGREVVAQCRQSDVETLEWVLSEIDAALLRTPHDPDRQTTRWYCPEGCGCALDSRSARYHDCRSPRGEGEAEQGPRAASLHRYLGQRSPEGYAVCEDCGARENTPEAARVCPVRSSEAQGELTILDRLQQEINEIASDDLLNVVALDALTTLASRMGFDANGSFPIGRHPSLVDASRPGWLTTPTNGGSDVR